MVLSAPIANLAVKIILMLFAYLPLKTKKSFLNHIVKSEKLTNDAISHYYFASNLEDKRFEKEDIVSAFNFARSRFPLETIFFVTDEYIYDHNVPSVTPIDSASIPYTFSKDDDNLKVFVCAFESDEKLLLSLKEIVKLKNAYYYNPLKYYPTARYFHRNDIARKVLLHERNINLPKFEVADYENIIQAIDITEHIEGDYVEIGVYQGRSAHMALNYMCEKKIERNSFFLDVFEGFTYDSATTSPDALWVNSHTDSSLEMVSLFLCEFENFEIFKVDIIGDELPSSIKSIAVCNIDVDMYEAVLAGLLKVAPLISKGGIIIVEDQGHTPALAGGYLATCEFLESEHSEHFIPVHMSSGQLYLIKI